MMNKTCKKRLVIAVAGAVGLGTSIAHAEDFNASATLQNTLAVTNLQDLDLGSVFATATGGAPADGVGAIVISPEGAVTTPTVVSSSVNLVSLTSPTAAQGSVDMTAAFDLTLPDTSAALAAEFDGAAVTSYASWTDGTAIELEHESANPAVPSLYLVHFTVGDVSGGTVGAEASQGAGVFAITPDFGETTYVFNIGATLTTQPGTGTGPGDALTYQEGIYAGTFQVTAAY